VECEDSLSYPGDRDAAVILRRIRAVSGPARVTVSCQPSSGFDSHLLSEAQKADGVWTGQVGDVRMRWQGAADAQLEMDGCLRFELELEQGEEHTLALELSRGPLPETPVDAAALLESTYRSWGRTVAEVDRPGTNADILQSYAVLAGLTSQDNGMVAAATMSLPERPKAHRDYDYRYVWIRDQCYAGQAVAQLGPNPLLEAALTFVSDRINEHGTDLKPAYRVDGGDLPDEHRVGLLGYPGGTNIAGNWVNDQFQLDTPGEALNLFAKAAELDRMNGRRWQAVNTCVRIIEERWQHPDAGVWELEDGHWTHSRLACVSGLRSIARHTTGGEAARWEALAEEILADTSAGGTDAEGVWQQLPDRAGTDAAILLPLVRGALPGDDPRTGAPLRAGQRDLNRAGPSLRFGARGSDAEGVWQQLPDRAGTDAAILLPLVRGALPVDDPRTVATLRAVQRDLNRDGHIFRFRHGGRRLGDAEGSFTVCGFITAL